MQAYAFTPGQVVQWNERSWHIADTSTTDQIILVDQRAGVVTEVAYATLHAALFDGSLIFLSPNGTAPPNQRYPDWESCPPHLRAIAEWRLAVITPLLALAGQRTKAAVLDRIATIMQERAAQGGQHMPPDAERRTLDRALSAASIYRWIARYEAAGHDMRALIPDVPLPSAPHRPRIDPRADTVITEAMQTLSLAPENFTIADVYYDIAAQIEDMNTATTDVPPIPTPSRRTVARRIAELDPALVATAKHGRRETSRRRRQHGTHQFPEDPLGEVYFDSTTGDTILADEEDGAPIGRFTATWGIDAATRCFTGFYIGFEPSSYLTYLEAIYHSILPKGDVRKQYGTEHPWLVYGKPAKIILDNEGCIRSQHMKDACKELGIDLEYAPVKMPEAKAAMERAIRTLNTKLLHKLRGTTFGSLQRRRTYNSLQKACLSLRELEQVAYLEIVDVYSHEFHTGLQGIPSHCWDEAVRMGWRPSLVQSAEQLYISLGRVAWRQVWHYGIEYARLKYNTDALGELRDRVGSLPVKIKFHPADLSQIFVYHPVLQRYLTVPSTAPEYTQGLSLWQHRVICQFARQEEHSVDPAALGRARRKIRVIVNTAKKRTCLLRTRRRIARHEQAGKTRSVQAHHAIPSILVDDPLSPISNAVVQPTPPSILRETPTATAAPAASPSPPSEEWHIIVLPTQRNRR